MDLGSSVLVWTKIPQIVVIQCVFTLHGQNLDRQGALSSRECMDSLAMANTKFTLQEAYLTHPTSNSPENRSNVLYLTFIKCS